MRITRLFLIAVFLVFPLLQPNAFAQDYTKWGLPDGVTTRLGKGYIRKMAFSPDGIRLAVASSIGVWIYDVRAGNEKELDLLTADMWSPTSVAYSPDGTTLASGSADGTVRLWNAVTGQHKITLAEHKGGVISIAYSPDGTTLASGCTQGTVRLWDTRTGKRKTIIVGHTWHVRSLAFSPHRSFVLAVEFSPDGTTLATGSMDGTIFLWKKLR